MAFKILPLEDMNALTAHILETVNTHMILRNNLTVRTQNLPVPPLTLPGSLVSPKGRYPGFTGEVVHPLWGWKLLEAVVEV